MSPEERAAQAVAETETQTRWLTPPEIRTWMSLWAMMHALDETLDRDLRATSGLNHNDYRLLILLSNAPDRRRRMSELADMIFESRSRLTYHVTQLERDGLVQREGYEADKRGAVAVLTPKGQELLRIVAPAHVAKVRSIFFDHLTPEQVIMLGDALHAVLAGLTEVETKLLDSAIEGEIHHD